MYAGTADVLVTGGTETVDRMALSGLTDAEAAGQAAIQTGTQAAVELLPFGKVGGWGLSKVTRRLFGESMEQGRAGKFARWVVRNTQKSTARALVAEGAASFVDEGILEPIADGLMTYGAEQTFDLLGVPHGQSREFVACFDELKALFTDPHQAAGLFLFTAGLTGAGAVGVRENVRYFAKHRKMWEAAGLTPEQVDRVMAADDRVELGGKLVRDGWESDPAGMRERVLKVNKDFAERGEVLVLTGEGALDAELENSELAPAYRAVWQEYQGQGLLPKVEAVGENQFRITKEGGDITLDARGADAYLQHAIDEVDRVKTLELQQRLGEGHSVDLRAELADAVSTIAGGAAMRAAEAASERTGVAVTDITRGLPEWLADGIVKRGQVTLKDAQDITEWAIGRIDGLVQEGMSPADARLTRASADGMARTLGDWSTFARDFARREQLAGLKPGEGAISISRTRNEQTVSFDGRQVLGQTIMMLPGNVRHQGAVEDVTESFADMMVQQRAQAILEGGLKSAASREELTIVSGNTSYKDAQEQLANVAEDIRNDETGITVPINTTQRNKLTSPKARRKSIANGFTGSQHNAVAAKIGSVFKHAMLLGAYNDRNNDPNIESMKRFATPIMVDGERAMAFLTVKSSFQKKGVRGEKARNEVISRLYSVELDEIVKLDGQLKRLEHLQQNASASSSEEIISRFEEKVKSVFSEKSAMNDAEAEAQAWQELGEVVQRARAAVLKADPQANVEEVKPGDRMSIIEALSTMATSKFVASGAVPGWMQGLTAALKGNLAAADSLAKVRAAYASVLQNDPAAVSELDAMLGKLGVYVQNTFREARVEAVDIQAWKHARALVTARAESPAGSGGAPVSEVVQQAQEKYEGRSTRDEVGSSAVSPREEVREAQEILDGMVPGSNAPAEMRGVFVDDKCYYNAAGGFWCGMIDKNLLRDGTEQVKVGAKGKHGVIAGRELTGRFQQNVGAIYVWKRTNGELQVISGRHRFAKLMEDDTAQSCNAYVFVEDAEHDERWARMLDYENNMRDDQADEVTAATYVRETGLSDTELEVRGLMRNGTRCKRGALIGRFAHEELWTRFINGAVKPMDAEVICNLTRSIRDQGRVEEIQRRCCMLLDEKKSWDYIGGMVQLMANKENVVMKQGLLDFGADFEADLARAAEWIEKNIKAINESVTLLKQGRKLSGKKRKDAERLGITTATQEGTEEMLYDLELLRGQFEMIGSYPDLVAQAQMWDGVTEVDPVGQYLERARAEREQVRAEAEMTTDEYLEEQARKAAAEAVPSLFSANMQRATPEMAEIKEAAERNGTFMKAPNGKPTKLTERQWLQVRTGAFKQWFGDWEKVARFNSAVQQLLSMSEVASITGTEFAPDGRKLTDKVTEFWNKEYGGVAKNPVLGDVVLDTRSVKASIAHGVGRLKSAAFAVVHDVIERGVLVEIAPDWKGRGEDSYVIAAPVQIGNTAYVCEVVVMKGETRTGFYLHEVQIKEKLLDVFKTGVITGTSGASKSILLDVWQRVKQIEENCSKVVDENGEPLVVYHGSLQWFQIFNDGNERHQSGAPDGTIFANDNREIAVSFVDYYGGNAENVILNANDERHARMPWGVYRKGGIYPLFMNLKNPLVVDFEGMTWHGEKYDIKDVNWYAVEARKKGHDGLIIRNVIDVGFTDTNDVPPSTDYVAFESNQVKSATDNRGTFDGGNADITFSVIGPKAKTWDRYKHRAFTGRDDGMQRAEIDASGAKLKAYSYSQDSTVVIPRFRAFIGFVRSYIRQHGRMQAVTDDWTGKQPSIDSYDEVLFIRRALEKIGVKFKSLGELVDSGVLEAVLSPTNANIGAFLKKTEWQPEGMSGYTKLEDVLDYPELYEAYPQLRQVPVLWQKAPKYRGLTTISQTTGDVWVNMNEGLAPERMISTLLHEVQHVIQFIEGYAAGTYDFGELRGWMSDNGYLEQALTMDNREIYARLAGEIESRNVQMRQDWTMDERLAKPFNETLEYPGEAITVRAENLGTPEARFMGDGGVTFSMPSVNTIFTASMEKASLRALDLLTIRADERAGEQLIKDWQAACESWGRFAREDAGRLGNGAKMLGEMQALIGATKGVLPERYCRMGHLNGLMRWASIYAKMQQDGTLPQVGEIKGPIYQKFLEKLQQTDELNRLQGMSEQEAQEAMALLAGERLDTAMMKVARECRRRLEQFLKDRELERIDHIVEKAYPKRQNGQKWPRGKMAADAYRRMERAREYMNLPADEVAERINDAKRKLDALDATDADFERKEEELEEEISLLQTFGCWENMGFEQARRACGVMTEMVLLGRARWKEKLQAERRRANYDRAQISRNFRTKLADVQRKRAKTDAKEKARKRTIGKKLAMGSMSYSQLMLALEPQLGKEFTGRHMRMIAKAHERLQTGTQQLHRRMFSTLSEITGLKTEGEMEEWLKSNNEIIDTGIVLKPRISETCRMTPEEVEEWLSLSKAARDARRKLAEEEAGAKGELPDNVPSEDVLEKMREKLEASRKAGTSPKEYVVTIEKRYESPLHCTKDAMLFAILTFEQEDYTRLMDVNGVNEKALQRMRELVGDKLLRWGYAMREILNEQGMTMAAIYEAHTGVPFAKRANYFRGVFDIAKAKDKGESIDSATSITGGKYGCLIPRQYHHQMLNWGTSATQVFIGTYKEQQNYICTSHITREWRTLLSNQGFEKRLRAEIGDAALDMIHGWCKMIDGSVIADAKVNAMMNRMLGRVMGAYAVSRLAGNVYTIIKQVSAVLNGFVGGYVPEQVLAGDAVAQQLTYRHIGFGEYAAALARAMSGQTEISAEEIANAGFIAGRKRVEGSHLEEAANLAPGQSVPGKVGRAGRAVYEANMDAIGYVDRKCNTLAALAVADAVYRAAKRENKDGPVPDAELRRVAIETAGMAIDRAAQPHLRTQKGYWAAGGGAFGAMGNFFYMFKSEVLGKLGLYVGQMFAGHHGAWIVGALSFGVLNSLVLALIDYVRGYWPGDDEEDKWKPAKQFVWNVFANDISAVPVLGDFEGWARSSVLGGRPWNSSLVDMVVPFKDMYTYGRREVKYISEGESWDKHVQALCGCARALGAAGGWWQGNSRVAVGSCAELALAAASMANVVRFGKDLMKKVVGED